MAIVCRLATESAGTTYDFLTANLRIQDNSWRIRTTRGGDLVSTFNLVGRTTDANILAAAAAIDEIIEEHELWHSNQFYEESLWFEYSATDETAKRALVKSIDFYSMPQGIFTPVLGETGVFYKMAITHGIWEDRSVTSVSVQTNKTTLGSTYTQAAIDGSAPARLSETRFQGQNVAGTLKEVWFGIRPTRDGLTEFEPLWELEDSSTRDGLNA